MTAVPLKVSHPPGRLGSSLKLRLIIAFSASFALCAAVLLVLLAQNQAKGIAAILSEHATVLAESVARLAHDKVAANDRIGLPAQLEIFNEVEMIRSLTITDRQGMPIAAVRRNAAGNMSAAPINGLGELGTPGLGASHQPALFAEAAPLIVWASIGKIAPIGWVRLEYETHQLAQSRQQGLTTYFVALIAMTLLAALLAYRLAIANGNAFKPLMRAARHLESLELDEIRATQVPESLPQEIAAPIYAIKDAAELIAALKANWSHNQEQYRRMLFALADPVVEIDSELKILGANPAWQKMISRDSPANPAAADSIAAQLNAAELEHLQPGILALVRGSSETLHERIRISPSRACCDAWFELDAYRLVDEHGNFASLLLHASPLKTP